MVGQSLNERLPPPEVLIIVLKPNLREDFYSILIFSWDLGDDVHFSSSSLFLVDLDIVSQERQFTETAGAELRHPRRIYMAWGYTWFLRLLGKAGLRVE